MRRLAMVLRCVVGVTAIAVMAGSGCDDPRDTTPDPAGTTNPVPAATRAAALLDRLAAGDTASLLDQRFAVFFPDGAALFVGTQNDTAIAYYCDPATRSSWLGGSNDFGQLQLVGADGVGFVGGIVGAQASGRLSGTRRHDGDVVLARSTDLTLERKGSGPGAPGRITGVGRSCGSAPG